MPWRRKLQLTPVLLPGEFHGQRSMAGCSSRGCEESDMTEQLALYEETALCSRAHQRLQRSKEISEHSNVILYRFFCHGFLIYNIMWTHCYTVYVRNLCDGVRNVKQWKYFPGRLSLCTLVPRVDHLPKCPGSASGKEPACQCRRHKSCGFHPWFGKIPWRRVWQLTPASLPGEIPWTEESGRLQSMGSQRVRHNWSNLAHMQAP